MNHVPSDNWASGDAYEAYMGRWSRTLAREFLLWLGHSPGLHWLDVGCGTGALTAAILEHCTPASIFGCDPSIEFIRHCRLQMTDERASFAVKGAHALPQRKGGFDSVVSGLALNFMPNPKQAVTQMRKRLAPGGTVAAYVWDYWDGLEFLRHFWNVAVALDAMALELDEGRRFPICHEERLAALFDIAGLRHISTGVLAVPTVFVDFDDYWTPFLGNTGPAPEYVSSLNQAHREKLRDRLQMRLAPGSDGQIRLMARAFVVRGSVG